MGSKRTNEDFKLVYNVDDDTEEEENDDTEDEEAVAKKQRYQASPLIIASSSRLKPKAQYNSNNNNNNNGHHLNTYVKQTNTVTTIIDVQDLDDDDTENESGPPPPKTGKPLNHQQHRPQQQQQQPQQQPQQQEFDFDFDDYEGPDQEEDESLKLALALSMDPANDHLPKKSSTSTTSTTSTTKTSSSSSLSTYNGDEYIPRPNSNYKLKPPSQQPLQQTISPIIVPSSLTPSKVSNTGHTFYLNQLPTNQNDSFINIFNIFGPPNMKSALICGFSMEDKWILSQLYLCQGKVVPTTLIKHWVKPSKEGKFMVNENLMIIHPPLSNTGFGCMHSKLMLLVYPDYIRVVIPSANPTNYDYDDIGQTVWLQDFKQPAEGTSPTCEFKATLKRFVQSMGMSCQFLDKYDFSTARATLIVSAPGYHSGTSLSSYGHMQLRSVLQRYYQEKEKDLEQGAKRPSHEVHYQCSSLGLVNDKWSGQFLESCHVGSVANQPQSASLNILFPSYTWVRQKKERLENSGIIFLTKNNYENESFPRSSFRTISHRYKHRENLVLHSKILIGTSNHQGQSKKRFDWIYVGSHNFSPAAWGRLQKNDSQLYIANFEIGVVLFNDGKYTDVDSLPAWRAHIPFDVPAAPFQKDEKPFIQEMFIASHSGVTTKRSKS
ncbi:hypothetical protein SAMD00019534_047540 [Acytostelium subglobosum LB1]|uniref:hypothetical protein n=1 Tax=Acytostelium subglobosum LB1 TaxID=1410327 RepID=UPI000644A128|nr:hypothetical protein SAMD00019534_047540 [Acytostelium subglobosum LB1]GAM21579.1 hypothetical protein SAMD00019534_047540 [Acytostelium subglobosum LB1]|eukprot:XP_012755698.1 hypothetical protein SAMD00019534_047540 [Acytostelium subglobosum LB1]